MKIRFYITIVTFFLTTNYSFAESDSLYKYDYDSSIINTHQHLEQRLDSLDKKLDSLNKIPSPIPKKSFNTMDIYNNIIAPLLVALLTGLFTWLWAKRRIKKKIDAAPRKYVEELDKLIKNGVSEGIQNAVLNARAIVATRNSLRNSLVAISSQLNSQIDRLANDIGEENYLTQGPSIRQRDAVDINSERAYDTILVLFKIWPAKKEQIEVELRKLLAELGLTYDSI